MVRQALQLQTPIAKAQRMTTLSTNFDTNFVMVVLFFEPELG